MNDALRTLRLVRAFIEAICDRVSTTFFTWSKEPGNAYITFLPTALIPVRADELRSERQGRALFQKSVSFAHASTVADYGGSELQVPWLPEGAAVVWPPPKSTAGLPKLSKLTSTTSRHERTAVRKLIASLDVDWLASNGHRDLETTTAVLEWLDRVTAAVAANAAGNVGMLFDRDPRPFNLWRMQVPVSGSLGVTQDIWWPMKHRLVAAWL